MTRSVKVMALAALLTVPVSAAAAFWFGPETQGWFNRGVLLFIALAGLVRAGIDLLGAVDDRRALRSAHPAPLSYLRLVQHGGDAYVAAVILAGLLRCAIALKLLLLSRTPPNFVIGLGWALYWAAPWLANAVARIGGSVAAALSYGMLTDHPAACLAVFRTGFSAVYALTVPEWQDQLTRWGDTLRKVPDPALVEEMMARVVDELARLPKEP